MFIHLNFRRYDVDHLEKDGFDNGQYDYDIWENNCTETVGLTYEGDHRFLVGDVVDLGNFRSDVSFEVKKVSFFVGQTQCHLEPRIPVVPGYR